MEAFVEFSSKVAYRLGGGKDGQRTFIDSRELAGVSEEVELVGSPADLPRLQVRRVCMSSPYVTRPVASEEHLSCPEELVSGQFLKLQLVLTGSTFGDSRALHFGSAGVQVEAQARIQVPGEGDGKPFALVAAFGAEGLASRTDCAELKASVVNRNSGDTTEISLSPGALFIALADYGAADDVLELRVSFPAQITRVSPQGVVVVEGAAVGVGVGQRRYPRDFDIHGNPVWSPCDAIPVNTHGA